MLHDAIQSLRPNKGFVMYNDDPSTIIWDDPKVKTPSQDEIDSALEALTNKLATEAAELAIAKEAILNRIGITEEEAKIILK